MDCIFDEISVGYEDLVFFVEFFFIFILLVIDSSFFNDGLLFLENLGFVYCMFGIEVYVDYVVGFVFVLRVNEF